MRGYPIEPYFIELGDISTLEKMVIYGRCMEVMSYSVYKYKLASKSSILDLL
jgi:hypothetical protein